jgi:hypothetical protein
MGYRLEATRVLATQLPTKMYMDFLSHAELRVRTKEILNNMLILSNKGQISLRGRNETSIFGWLNGLMHWKSLLLGMALTQIAFLTAQ